MTKSPARHLDPAGGKTYSQRLETQEFARRLYNLLIEKGWKQSDLARACWGTTFLKSGREVPAGRDKISMYVLGKSIPEPGTMKKIADALGVKVSDLAPDITAHTIKREEPEFYIQKVPGEDNAFVKIERVIPVQAAYEIYGILLRYDALTSPKRHSMTPEQFEDYKKKELELERR